MSEDGKHIDIELYMYAHYLQCGHDLRKLCNLSESEKSFYIASMIIMKEQDAKNKLSLADYVSNKILQLILWLKGGR